MTFGINKGMFSLNTQYLPSHLGLGFWIVDPYKVILIRPSPRGLSMRLQIVKFIVKKSTCSAQEIGFSAPNLCNLLWLVKGISKKECHKMDLTVAHISD